MTYEPSIRFALRREDLETAAYPEKDSAHSRLHRAAFRLLTGAQLPPAAVDKAWDVRNVLDMTMDVPHDAAILDCGAFNSPSTYALLNKGYGRLYGIDLDPHLVAMPFGRKVRFTVQNIEKTSFEDGSFDCLTCCSTIEHGVSWDRFLAEARRLLKEGGRLYLSTDIVHNGTPTEGEAFGQPWQPLTPTSLQERPALFQKHGFTGPEISAVTLPSELPMQFLGKPLGFVGFGLVAS